jgi:DNA sulfur modification protein DndE
MTQDQDQQRQLWVISGKGKRMLLNKIKVSEDVDQKLKQLKSRTGLTPNLLCRIGFCLSLRENGIPDPSKYDEKSNREFNRYTLTGNYDAFFVSLLAQRCYRDGLKIPYDLDEQFRAHLNRGVLLLFQRVKHLNDLSRLIENSKVEVTESIDSDETWSQEL